MRGPVGEFRERRAKRSDAWTPKQAEPDASEVEREEPPNRAPAPDRCKGKRVATGYFGCMRIAPSTRIVSPFTIALP